MSFASNTPSFSGKLKPTIVDPSGKIGYGVHKSQTRKATTGILDEEKGEKVDGIEKFPVLKLTTEGETSTEAAIAQEIPLTIILNDQELVTLLCSPADFKYLAVGFLASEGLVSRQDEIERITVDDQRGVVRIKTKDVKDFSNQTLFKRVISSGCGRGVSFYSAADTLTEKVDSQIKISADEVFNLVSKFQHNSNLYLATHGVHSAALCDTKSILVFSEDIGRHNAIDKIIGKCLLENIPTTDRAMITTGRITSEILHKVANSRIPIIISISAPTNLGIKIADTMGITLITSVKGKKMSVYNSQGRIIPGDQPG